MHPNEHHLLVRAEATLGARLNDPYSAGVLSPVSPFLQASYQFVHVGSFLMGPSVGFQAGVDASGAQFAIAPGWQAFRRFSGRFAMNARLDLPILITRGACPSERQQPQPPLHVLPGAGFGLNRNSVPVPSAGYCAAATVGVEAAVGAALYITSGVAVTGELIFDLYFGDSAIMFPILGGGLGILIDYEVLP